MTFTDERLEELSSQHHMEGGGYRFDNARDFAELEDRHGLVEWDSPDYDYLLGDCPAPHAWNTTFLYEPHGYPDAEWPEVITWTDPDDGEVMRWRRAGTGCFYDSETECGCSGGYPTDTPDEGDRAEIHSDDPDVRERLTELLGWPVQVLDLDSEAGVARVRLLREHPGTREFDIAVDRLRLPFEFDGSSDTDRAYPYCSHCEGNGTRAVEPGCWAVYDRIDDDEEDEDDE